MYANTYASSGRVFLRTGLWGRRYDHNFLRFSTIFGEKFGALSPKPMFDQLKKTSAVYIKMPFFAKKNWRKYFKNHN
jgi:hypothetical protein